MTDDCAKLDAWLADALAAEDAASFAAHLPRCEGCREVVEQQRWIDGLMQSEVRKSLEPVPERLRELVGATPLRPEGQSLGRRVAVLAAVAAAVLVAIGTAITVRNNSLERADAPVESGVASNVPERFEEFAVEGDHVAEDSPETPKATFVSNQDMIAVPVDSIDDNVTIVQLYRTTEAERRSRHEFAYQFNLTEPSGG